MDQPESLELGQPETYHNLRLYPVHANNSFLKRRKNVSNYLTLKESIDQGKVVVTEHVAPGTPGREAQADVNTLFIENNSLDTVLILNGEVVQGGNQDRMVTTDVVLAPHSGRLDLAVFCVERGRWAEQSGEFKIQEHSLPPNDVRSVVSVPATHQGDVWDQVQVSLNLNLIESPSDDIMDLKSDDEYLKKISQYSDVLGKVFSKTDDIIGVIAVSGDGVIGCDLFASPALFAKHFPNLLQSYAAQAQSGQDIKIKPDEIRNYWRRVMGMLKREGGFLRTKGERGEENQVHFSMGTE